MKTKNAPFKMSVKRGDTVVVLSGADAGKTGQVLQAFPKQGRVIVEGVRYVTKHLRKSQDNPKGAIVRKEAPLHVSKIRRQAAAPSRAAPAAAQRKAP